MGTLVNSAMRGALVDWFTKTDGAHSPPEHMKDITSLYVYD